LSVLSDNEIVSLAASGKLITKNFSSDSVTPNGYDVRIGSIMYKDSATDHCSVSPTSGFYVSSLEYFAFPETIMGEIWIRSSYSRKGLIGSFGAIDAGFSGNLTFFFMNAGTIKIELSSGDRIAQIVFHRLGRSAVKGYEKRSGNYQFSEGITLDHKRK